MEIKTKLSIGDSMFIITKTEYNKPIVCDACGGDGFIKLRNLDEIECPKCYGKTYLENKGIESWKIFDDRRPDSFLHVCGRLVGKIDIEVSKDGRKKELDIKIKYTPKGICNYFYETEVFKTEEAALIECNKRNAALVN